MKTVYICNNISLNSSQNRMIQTKAAEGIKTHSLYVEIKCQLDATEVFIADLIAYSTC